MPKNILIYIILGILGIAAFYGGITGKKILFISNPRSAVFVLTIIGFIMCSLGNLGIFINKAPGHPLTVLGYILGTLALLVGTAQILKYKLPFISEPKIALSLIVAVIIIKFIIARLSFLLPVK